MSTFAHSRTSSAETTASAASYQLVLEHILAYPGTYELPLRTMYTLNCTPRAQPLQQLSRTPSTSSSASNSPVGQQFPYDAAAHLQSSLMAQLSQLPSQSCSLPPTFIANFLRKCFHPVLELVDFPQSLASLDYLKDLETRKRKDIAAAYVTIGLDPNRPLQSAEDASYQYPLMQSWVEQLEDKNRKTENLYAQMYIGFRRWILVNEFRLKPFNKHNCLAMLNTLYPPLLSTAPTRNLTPETLKGQRDVFFRYIGGVEKKGPSVLDPLITFGARKERGEEDGWGLVQNSLEEYLRITLSILDDCAEVTGVGDFAPADDLSKRGGRKVDSGVSFGSDKTRPSTSDTKSISVTEAPPTPHTRTKSSGSKLERLAREFRKIKLGRKVEVEEIVKSGSRPTTPDVSRRDPEVAHFDRDQMMQSRMRYEAKLPGRKMSSYEV
ncbi:hypothetical protein M501DRAFT_1008751 [Patellaria atrata CBS 101060]|uniref:Uncharacterized protein n=1 Tax=Patellaria atrata CBS 101060 TaxID=1346257 RepID=A0A9P4S4U8_9PEZI|nr:hypothetical protein M501DRAFT_1008751 [Patellaria atrata CBS 101060]